MHKYIYTHTGYAKSHIYTTVSLGKCAIYSTSSRGTTFGIKTFESGDGKGNFKSSNAKVDLCKTEENGSIKLN